MKLILILFTGTTNCLHLVDKDAFDDSLGVFTASSTDDRGWDEANDYDREMERPENVKYDDDSWKDFSESFNKM